MRRYAQLLILGIGACGLAPCVVGSGAQADNPKLKAIGFEDDWTAIYARRWTGLPGTDAVDRGVFPGTIRFSKGKVEKDEKDPYFGVSSYEFEPRDIPWALDLFRRDPKGEVIENTYSQALYYLRDDFLMIAHGRPIRPVGFFVDPESRPHLCIYRRGKLTVPRMSRTFAKENQLREKEAIEGTWTKIYYESQGLFFSLASMVDLSAARTQEPRKLPFAEHVPLQWKITKNEIEEGGETEESPVRRYAYSLNPHEGELDMVPLDKRGATIDNAKREAVYFVKDDFLFVRYRLEPQRWRLSRPDRVFTSDQESKTAILILRRGPVKWDRAPAKSKANGGYIFQRIAKTPVLLDRFPFYYEGYLNDDGVFVPDPKAPPIECKVRPAAERDQWIDALEAKRFPILNRSYTRSTKPVYQFSAGDWLILGALHIGGAGGGSNFVPAIERGKATVISMDQYLKDYDPENSHAIYNLLAGLSRSPKRARRGNNGLR